MFMHIVTKFDKAIWGRWKVLFLAHHTCFWQALTSALKVQASAILYIDKKLKLCKSFAQTGMVIQWGSEIRTSLDFEKLKGGWVPNGPDFEWDLKSGSPTIWNLNKWLPFCQKLFEIRTKMSGFWMIGTIAIAKPGHLKTGPFEIRQSKNPDFKWSDFRSQLYNC